MVQGLALGAQNHLGWGKIGQGFRQNYAL